MKSVCDLQGLDYEAEVGAGPDVVVLTPTSLLQDAVSPLVRNPPRRKTRVQHPPLDDLYAGMSKLLVRTALIRSPGWERGKRKVVTAPEHIAELCRHLVHADQEHLVALAFDNGNQLLAIHEAAIGTSSGAGATATQLTKVAMLTSATRMAMVHNHPSGLQKPSAEDIEMTHNVHRSLDCLGLPLLDHVIVAYDGWYSFEGARSMEWGR